jgi:hypothetical protein
VVRTDWLRWSSEECCAAGPAVEGRNARGRGLVVRGRRTCQLPAGSGLPADDSHRAASVEPDHVDRGGLRGSREGAAEVPTAQLTSPWSPGPRDWPRWHRPGRGWRNGMCFQDPLGSPGHTRQNDRLWRPTFPRPCFPGQQRPSPPVCAGAPDQGWCPRSRLHGSAAEKTPSPTSAITGRPGTRRPMGAGPDMAVTGVSAQYLHQAAVADLAPSDLCGSCANSDDRGGAQPYRQVGAEVPLPCPPSSVRSGGLLLEDGRTSGLVTRAHGRGPGRRGAPSFARQRCDGRERRVGWLR